MAADIYARRGALVTARRGCTTYFAAMAKAPKSLATPNAEAAEASAPRNPNNTPNNTTTCARDKCSVQMVIVQR
ncbi:MAG: hypothetical protein AB7I44_13920 [Hyphomicrobiaceae bacterium]